MNTWKDDSICPYCSSENIVVDHHVFEEKRMEVFYECAGCCRSSWVAIYILDRIESTEQSNETLA